MHQKQGITLYVAQELDDLNLFTDLLDYLLPAGLSCNIIKESQHISTVKTVFELTDTVTITRAYESELSTVAPASRIDQLSLGQVGSNPSIIANVTVLSKNTLGDSKIATPEIGGELKNE
jgi:hypothetical protein